jgi:glutathione S-transferase
MLTVWGRVNSINVQKVLWTLAELGLAYRRIDAGMAFGVVGTPHYLAMNPNALIPTIDDDGYVLWESNVIVRYLASKHAMGTLCPADPHERFLAERWMDWQAATLSPAMHPVFIGLIRTPPEKRDTAAIAAGSMSVERWMAVLDGHLASRRYINGETFTMGDIPVGAAALRWYSLPAERQPRPNVERWLALLRERPGFTAHVDQPPS